MKPLIIWHKPHWRAYAWANSQWGRFYAKSHGCNARDVDLRMTADGVMIATHEGYGVHEFPGHPDPHQMPWRKVSKLRHERGFHIRSAARTLVTDTQRGMTPCFEAKPDARMTKPETWARLVRIADRLGVRLVVMCQPHGGHGIKVLAAAKEAGAYTMLLTRGPVQAEWWDALDAAKGPRRHMRNKPAGKVRFGPGALAGRSKVA